MCVLPSQVSACPFHTRKWALAHGHVGTSPYPGPWKDVMKLENYGISSGTERSRKPGTPRCRLWLAGPRMLMLPLWASASLTLTSLNVTRPSTFLSEQTRYLWESTLYTIRCCISFLRAIISKYHNLGGLSQQKCTVSQFWRLEV